MYQGSEFTFLALNKSLEIKEILEEVAMQVDAHCICVDSSQELLEGTLEYKTDLIIMDMGIGLEEIKKTLKTMFLDIQCKEIPIFMLCDAQDIEALCIEFKDYPVISIVTHKNWKYQLNSLIGLLKRKNTNEEILNESLQESESQNKVDPLTGALNRFGAEHKFQDLVADFEERNKPFSLIMFDIDFFKKINDEYGHDVGDEILVSICSLVQHDIRKDDALIRFGGEEFIVFLSNASLEMANMKAQGFRTAMEAKGHGFDKLKVTASFGVLEYKESESLDVLFSKVDKLLYEAKEKGRNRVVSA
ncbi:MAG: hypothetical protein COA44_00185 [Arcobacter sp.]|nr:MAG: hypothetical protein COA44_00185 [Arcobacter sp.]